VKQAENRQTDNATSGRDRLFGVALEVEKCYKEIENR